MKLTKILALTLWLTLKIFLLTQSSISCKDKSVFPALPFDNLAISQQKLGKVLYPRKKEVQSIMIHSTNQISAGQYLALSIKAGMMVHLLIDSKGRLYGIQGRDSFYSLQKNKTIAAPGMDDVTIHLALEGSPWQILTSKSQLQKAVFVINKLAKKFNIAKTNYDISSKKGIFTHTQSKIKFGAFIKMYPEDGGERVLAYILRKLKGKYYPQVRWKDRFTPDWVFRRENKNFIRSRGKLTKGQGLTRAPLSKLNSVWKKKNGQLYNKYRIKYVDRGKINPSCIVLHFSGSSSFRSTKADLERRRLAATFIAGPKGKIFQVMDQLIDKPAAATGTNGHCMQIEIVGRSEQELLKNSIQMKKVAGLLKELAKKFKFPLHNHDISSHQGVFSHTQAKRKWGHSVWIVGDDFDPGERYMKKVIELSGGRYYSEKDWKDRKSLGWAILYRSFQP